ncbi:MAG TPA: lipopolysaccharide heptosyltransferase I [Thermoanaerobaculaceae bacterium]|nr:lipopolysaccharide heptosyltransferase I [Thermoanaerobaculaceae bacterium]HRS16083.1 lipopolysaccharide heptosyltransferase I [Thermoanaerobaculaceae bacterium]
MRVLLTRLSALGDIVHTWPLAAALRGARPDLELYWLVERHFAPLVEAHPAVAGVIPVATRRWRTRWWSAATRREVRDALARLRELDLDVALDPQGLVKSAAWARLARVPRRVGLAARQRRERAAGLLYTTTVTPPPGASHVVDVNLSLASALGVVPEPGAAPDGRFLLAGGTGPRPPAGAVVILPATGGPGKAWPPSCWAVTAAAVARLGHPVWVAWGPGERALAEQIAVEAGVEIAPPTSIVELAHLLAGAAVVLGADTGTVHLAASIGVPTVAVFLATDPGRNGPRGARVAVVSAARGGARRGRARTGAAREVDPGEVLAALRELAG